MLRRGWPPDPVGCGTMRYVTMVPVTITAPTYSAAASVRESPPGRSAPRERATS
jgi:hypothetical protein